MDSNSEQPKIVAPEEFPLKGITIGQDEAQMQKLRDQLAAATNPNQKEVIKKQMAQLVVDNLSSKA